MGVQKMEDYKNRASALGRSNMGMATAYQAVNVAVLAIIVFGDVAEASDGIKRLVAFSAVITSITAWIFSSNALRAEEVLVKDMSPAEAATAAGNADVPADADTAPGAAAVAAAVPP